MDPEFLRAFILDPSSVDPSTTMPHVLARLDPVERTKAASELTHFIWSLRDQPFIRPEVDAESAARGESLFHSIGCLACHDDLSEPSSARVSLVHVAKKYNVESLAEFLEDPHRSRPQGRMPNMQLSHWEALDVAAYLMREQSTELAGFAVDELLARAGRDRFVEMDCVQCHAISGVSGNRQVPALAVESLRAGAGCLSKTSGAWPQYELRPGDIAAITAAVEAESDYQDADRLLLSLELLNCVACHDRDGWGGVGDRDEFFRTTNPNLGPQGRIPPTLTNVGAKLKQKWLRQVLVSGRTIRPYMNTRMPQFGTQHVGHLPDLFHRLDRLPVLTSPPGEDDKVMRTAGFDMVSRDGLNCIACHNFQRKQAATMPAVDLTEMTERLQKNWFLHYLREPQRLSSGTVMPTFWPGGKSLRSDILNGDTARQLEALWRYLSDGRQARTPRGLVRERMELLATSEAVMLRRSWPDVGKRGIGVGYPSLVNQVFDAEQMRLAILWQGKFADPGGVWRSQGHGVAHPLQREQYRFAKGPDLDDAEHPWVVDEGRPPHHQFLGYDLDRQQRPRFHYRFETLQVTDYLRDLKEGQAGALQRVIAFDAPKQRLGVRLRLASSETIQRLTQHRFLVGKRLEVEILDQPPVEIVRHDDVSVLQVQLDIPAGKSQLQVAYRWQGEPK